MSRRGFIQIPILIAIIVGVLVVGGAGYIGVKQISKSSSRNTPQQPENVVTQDNQATSTPTSTPEISEVEKLRQEVEELKKQQLSSSKPQAQPPAPKKEVINAVPIKRTTLSNAEIIKRVKPATVFIETTEGVGSGMIIDVDGYILTNAHVVEDVSVAKIKLSDGRTLTASVIGRDENIDLAILKISGSNFSKVELGNSDEVAQGDEVFTLGYPFGLEGDVSFKEGTISSRISDESSTYLETSAEIHPGNSGGPLVNKYGEVIGVNTAVLGSSIKGIAIGETIKLAIPIDTAKAIIEDLKMGRNQIVRKTYAPIPLSDISSLPYQDQVAIRNIYNEFLKTLGLQYMTPEGQRTLLNSKLDAYTLERQAQLQREATAQQALTDQINALIADCTQRLNSIDNQIIAVQNQYYADVENVRNKKGVSSAYVNNAIQKLTNDANFEIQKLDTQRESVRIDCLNRANAFK